MSEHHLSASEYSMSASKHRLSVSEVRLSSVWCLSDVSNSALVSDRSDRSDRSDSDTFRPGSDRLRNSGIS